MPTRLAALFGLLVLAVPAATAGGDMERILSYHSDIQVQANGTLTVTETIKVHAALDKIKRGIYRDFPVRYVGRDRSRVIVPFQVLRVQRDGLDEPWHSENKGNYKRIYVGRKNVFLKTGVYTYAITYKTGRQLGFFKDHDELYWNVTGNDWIFPIEKASATITLPGGVPAGEVGLEAYTGRKGAKGKNYVASLNNAGKAQFRTTRALGRGQGLTVVVTFPKGIVVEPIASQKLQWLLSDNAMILAALVGLATVGIYFVAVWTQVGVDPPKGTATAIFEPLEGMCPASLRYILRMGFDKVCFTAAVLNLAVKGCLTIEDEDGEYALARVDATDESQLSVGEKKVASRLFAGRPIVELDNKNHVVFQKGIRELKKVLANTYKGRYFFANLKWFAPGVILSVATLAAVAVIGAFVEGRPEVAFISIWLTFWTFGMFFLIGRVVSSWKAVRSPSRGALAKRGGAVFMTLFSIPFVAAEIGVLGFLVHMTSIWLLPILVGIGLLNAWFYHLLKRPTVEGRELMDRIEGFRVYLASAGQEPLSYAHAPQRTPELFEKYLPYALALDVENAWAEKFSDVLQQATVAVHQGRYRPCWYRGGTWRTAEAEGFASSFAGSFSGALSSASTAPGSSSGSGGGSSGGGGGGGGGGGW